MNLLKKVINRKNERGSLSVEALIVTPVAILVVVVFCILLKSLYIYEAMDQCLSNVSETVSGNIVFASLSHSDGFAEKIARVAVVDHVMQEEIAGSNLNWQKNLDEKGTFEIVEENFDEQAGAGLYSLQYAIELPGGFKSISLEHRVRIRSLWQFPLMTLTPLPPEENEDDEYSEVYTSNRGREEGIYHTDPDCWSLKRSWKKEGSVKKENEGDLSGYRECLICARKRAEQSQGISH